MEMKLNSCKSLTCGVNVASNVAAESLSTLTLFVQGNLRRMAIPGDFNLLLLVCIKSLKVVKSSRLHFPIRTQIDRALILEHAAAAIIVWNIC